MYISKVYLTDNFVPDKATDPFRRRVAGYEVTVREGEDYKEAERFADEKISDYIKNNSIESMMGTTTRTIEPALTGIEGIIADINACTELEGNDGLYSFTTFVSNNPELKQVYDNKLKQLKP